MRRDEDSDFATGVELSSTVFLGEAKGDERLVGCDGIGVDASKGDFWKEPPVVGVDEVACICLRLDDWRVRGTGFADVAGGRVFCPGGETGRFDRSALSWGSCGTF